MGVGKVGFAVGHLRHLLEGDDRTLNANVSWLAHSTLLSKSNAHGNHTTFCFSSITNSQADFYLAIWYCDLNLKYY